MSKEYFSIGFSKSLEAVESLVEQEAAQLDSELKQHFPDLENFITNLGSLAFAKGYELAKTETEQIDKIREELD